MWVGPAWNPSAMSPKIPRGGPEHREIKQEGNKGNSFSNIPNTEFISQGGKKDAREKEPEMGGWINSIAAVGHLPCT